MPRPPRRRRRQSPRRMGANRCDGWRGEDRGRFRRGGRRRVAYGPRAAGGLLRRRRAPPPQGMDRARQGAPRPRGDERRREVRRRRPPVPHIHTVRRADLRGVRQGACGPHVGAEGCAYREGDPHEREGLALCDGIWGTGNGERGTGNGEWGTGNGEWGTGNGERGTGWPRPAGRPGCRFPTARRSPPGPRPSSRGRDASRPASVRSFLSGTYCFRAVRAIFSSRSTDRP